MPKTKYTEGLRKMTTSQGVSIKELSKDHPVLLVFLRHMGCIFCREAMKEIGSKRNDIEGRGVVICLVHMSPIDEAEKYFSSFGLEGIAHISDPTCELYRLFGLVKGSFGQLYGLQVWMRTAQIAIQDPKLFSAKVIGDGLQMPGMFLIENEEVTNTFIHKRASDRPDYEGFINCCEVDY